MAINGVNQLSNEQLLAMSMATNGQITNDSSSRDASDVSGEQNYAFQLAMQNLIDSSKKSEPNSAAVANNVAKVDNKESKINEKAAKADSKKVENGAATSNNDLSTAAKMVQLYATGQKLQDIPMVLNNNYIAYTQGASAAAPHANSADMQKIYNVVNAASKKYGVDSNLIMAVIKQESDFNSNSTSGVGAAGLMQIMPENNASLGITDQYDVDQNINGGTKLLKEYLDQYNGNTEMALMAYNGGPGTMQRRGVSSAGDLYKMPEETQNYVPKVMGYYRNGV